MNIIESQSLGAVVLPLVRVMAEADLSWADREKVSAAIYACYMQWAAMEKERQQANQTNATGQLQTALHSQEQSAHHPNSFK